LSAPDGKPFPSEISISEIEAGGQKLYTAIVRDITERKRTEQALQQSEEKYRALFQNAQVGMYRSRLDGSAILAVNRKYCEIYGFSEVEMLGNPSTIHWAHTEDREQMESELRKAGSLQDYEVDIITKSGEVRTCSLSAQIYIEQDYLEGSIIDITERKRVEAQLAERHATLNAILESTATPVFSLDRGYRYTSFNSAMLLL